MGKEDLYPKPHQLVRVPLNAPGRRRQATSSSCAGAGPSRSALFRRCGPQALDSDLPRTVRPAPGPPPSRILAATPLEDLQFPGDISPCQNSEARSGFSHSREAFRRHLHW